jgi:hypothetical protein
MNTQNEDETLSLSSSSSPDIEVKIMAARKTAAARKPFENDEEDEDDLCSEDFSSSLKTQPKSPAQP